MNYTKTFRLGLIVFLLCLQNITSHGQTNSVRGIVYDKETQLPIEGVICKIYNSDKISIGYLLSNPQGIFEGFFTSYPVSMSFALIGYQDMHTKTIGNNMEIYLEPKAFEIDEILIQTPLISRDKDTLNYSITRFKSREDRHLIDVLNRLPGVEVSPSGAIKYEGKSINKFYIEGLDLMGQRYGIATKSLPIEAISSIQIIENNQHIKTLKDIEIPDEAAVNIKLNESYQHRPFGQIEGALGFEPYLIQTKLFASKLGKKQQSLIRLQTDNTGIDIISDSEELVDLSHFFFYSPTPRTYITTPKNTTIPMEKKRYINNETYTSVFNHLYKVSEYETLRYNGIYTKDYQWQEIENQSDYFLLDQHKAFQLNENILNRAHRSKIDFTTRYENNNPKTYLSNEINTLINWSQSIKTISNRFNNTAQTTQKSYQVQNKFSTIFGSQDNKYSINSFSRWISQPEVFANEHKIMEPNTSHFAVQNIRNTHFLTKLQFHKNTALWGHTLSNGLELFFNNDQIKTDLQTSQKFSFLEQYELINRIKLLRFGAAIKPEFIYYKEKWRATLILPLRFEANIAKNQLIPQLNSKTPPFFVNPHFNTTYTLNPFFRLSLNASKTTHIGTVQNYLSGIVMTDYRNYYRATDLLEKRIAQNYNFRIDYQDLITAFFFNISLSYQPVKSNLMNHNFNSPDYQFTTTLLRDLKSSTRSLETKANKYFSTLKTTLDVNLNYKQHQSDIFQQEVLFNNYSNSFRSNFTIHFKQFEWFTFNYNWGSTIFWEKNKYIKTNPLKTVNQDLKIYFFPSRNLHLNLSVEHNCIELSENLITRNYFLDLESKYKLAFVEFFLNVQNLLNQKNYSYTSFSGVNSSTMTMPIRPRTLLFGAVFSF